MQMKLYLDLQSSVFVVANGAKRTGKSLNNIQQKVW